MSFEVPVQGSQLRVFIFDRELIVKDLLHSIVVSGLRVERQSLQFIEIFLEIQHCLGQHHIGLDSVAQRGQRGPVPGFNGQRI